MGKLFYLKAYSNRLSRNQLIELNGRQVKHQ